MKKATLIAGGIVICFIFIAGYYFFIFPFTTYIDRLITTYTKISNYSTIEKVHNDGECYAKIVIAEKDGDRLLRLYPFKHCYTKKVIAGLAQQQYIKDCCECWYFLDDKNQGLYRYKLCCLSQDKKHLEIYECFGD